MFPFFQVFRFLILVCAKTQALRIFYHFSKFIETLYFKNLHHFSVRVLIYFSKFCVLSNNDFIVDSAIFQTFLSLVCYQIMILLLIQQFFKLFSSVLRSQ